MKEIVFENVCKSYGKAQIVNNLNLTIKEGERLILLGPSGCGKSTTLRMIAGLEDITSGKLYMNGKCVNNVKSGERNIAMVFQNYALFPHMTVEENITYGLKVHKFQPSEVKDRLNSAIRAIVKRSDYFLLDEPLSNLDAQLRGHARKELVKIHELYNQTFVYVTHDQVEAMTMGDRIALMNKGTLQMVDTPANVYNKPANIFTAKFIGSPSTNVFEVNYNDRKIVVGDQKISISDEWIKLVEDNGNTELCIGIRPEHINLQFENGKNSLKGFVKYVEDYGNKVGVYIEVEGNEVIAILEENKYKSDDVVYFELDFSKIHLFDRKTTMSIGYPKEI